MHNKKCIRLGNNTVPGTFMFVPIGGRAGCVIIYCTGVAAKGLFTSGVIKRSLSVHMVYNVQFVSIWQYLRTIHILLIVGVAQGSVFPESGDFSL